MSFPRVCVCAGLLALAVRPAGAADDFAASLRLRGGYDTNPQFSNGLGIGGSAFVATDLALAAGTKEEGYSFGAAAEASRTQYFNPLAPPASNGKVILRGLLGDDQAGVSAVTTLSDISTYNLRATDAIQAVKGEAKFGAIKLFTTVEGAHSSLNQTNAFFQDFLPNPHVYLRGTVIPGIAFARDKFEIGTSVNLSVRRYTQELDDFGYRRDNERIQPFVFARYSDDDITVAGSISHLRGTWHDVDFSNVSAYLYDANLTWRLKPFTIDLAASRRANETTFPISPITLDRTFTGKISWQAAPNLTLNAAAGYISTQYLDSPFSAQTVTYGVGLSHDLGHGYAFGFDVTRAQGTLISGEKASAIIVMSSLTKRFTPFAADTPAPKVGGKVAKAGADGG